MFMRKAENALSIRKDFPLATFCISFLTFVTSISVASYLHGAPWSTVTIAELRHYGGLDFPSLFHGEMWRLITAQLVHVKQAHMMFNVVSLIVLGASVEPITGRAGFLLLWFLSGALGLITSVYFGQYPYEVGTGASQAIMGLVAANLIAVFRNFYYPLWKKWVLASIFFLSVVLDAASAHYPKPGHVAGFIAGLCLGYYLLPKAAKA
jgi:rhomboid protease GluP